MTVFKHAARNATLALSASFMAVQPAVAQSWKVYDCPPPPEKREVCSPASARDMAEKLPLTAYQLDQVEAAKLSGKPVVKSLYDKKNGYTLCEHFRLPVPNGTIGQTNFGQRKMWMSMTIPGLGTMAHESFHFYQFRKGLWDSESKALTVQDHSLAVFLVEASAIAYSNVFYRELGYKNPEIYANYKKEPYGRESDLFDAAHDAAMERLKDFPLKTRREAALSEGAQAIVRALLSGSHERWRVSYNRQAGNWIYGRTFPATGLEEGYAARRDAIFATLGDVGKRIHMTPPELTGERTNEYVSAYLARLKFDPAAVQGARSAPKRPVEQVRPIPAYCPAQPAS